MRQAHNGLLSRNHIKSLDEFILVISLGRACRNISRGAGHGVKKICNQCVRAFYFRSKIKRLRAINVGKRVSSTREGHRCVRTGTLGPKIQLGRSPKRDSVDKSRVNTTTIFLLFFPVWRHIWSPYVSLKQKSRFLLVFTVLVSRNDGPRSLFFKVLPSGQNHVPSFDLLACINVAYPSLPKLFSISKKLHQFL